uniref:LEDGF domain-containing protein n=1 Tax=Steinernema glaseri TaxID=37863 RepID=A0A1I7YPN8_9BILA
MTGDSFAELVDTSVNTFTELEDVPANDDWIFDSLGDDLSPSDTEQSFSDEKATAAPLSTASTTTPGTVGLRSSIDPAAIRLPGPATNSTSRMTRQTVDKNMRALIIAARKQINSLKSEISILNTRLEASQVVKCPSCDHQFSAGIKQQLRPEYVRVLRGRLVVELQFADIKKLTDWLYLTGLHEDNSGAPVMPVSKPTRLTLEMVGSKLVVPTESGPTTVSKASKERPSVDRSVTDVKDAKRSPNKPLCERNDKNPTGTADRSSRKREYCRASSNREKPRDDDRTEYVKKSRREESGRGVSSHRSESSIWDERRPSTRAEKPFKDDRRSSNRQEDTRDVRRPLPRREEAYPSDRDVRIPSSRHENRRSSGHSRGEDAPRRTIPSERHSDTYSRSRRN